jgi:hypothetical protein
VAVQTRRLSARNDFAGNAIVSGGYVLVAHDTGRALHTPLPDDERACAFDYHSGSTRKQLLLPSLCCQTDPRFYGARTKRQRFCGANIHRFGSGCPRSSDKSRTARSSCPRIVSLPAIRLLHFPDLGVSLFVHPS